MQKYSGWETEELIDHTKALKYRLRYLEKRGARNSVQDRLEIKEIRSTLKVIQSEIGKRHVQLKLL